MSPRANVGVEPLEPHKVGAYGKYCVCDFVQL